MSETRLAPCPFCGGEAKVSPCFTDRDKLLVLCIREDCANMGYFHTEEEAIEAWNTRAERKCSLEYDGLDTDKCSECGADMPCDPGRRWERNYCPSCGAKVAG